MRRKATRMNLMWKPPRAETNGGRYESSLPHFLSCLLRHPFLAGRPSGENCLTPCEHLQSDHPWARMKGCVPLRRRTGYSAA